MLFIYTELIQFVYQLFRRKTKIVGFFGLLILAYLVGTTDPVMTSDYAVYEYVYDNQLSQGLGVHFEHGYTFLSHCFYQFGWDYQSFRMFFSILAAVILYFGITRFTKNVALFSVLYGISIFFIDATQIRNFMMVALIAFGISFLKDINIKNVVLSVFFVILSAEFQSLGYIFMITILLMVLFRKSVYQSRKTYSIVFPIVSLLAMLFIYLMGISRFSDLLVKIVSLVGSREGLAEKVSGQYVYGTGIKYLLMVSISSFLNVLFISKLYSLNLNDKLNLGKINILYWMTITGALCLPFLFMAVDYSRIQRAVFVFVLIGIAMFTENISKYSKDAIMKMSFLIIVVVIANGVTHNLVWGMNFIRTIPYIIHHI